MSEVVTIAGGVVAVYVILALIVSQMVEWVNTVINLRGRLLYYGILEMLSGRNSPPGSPARTLVEAIYSHPLVGNLGMKKLPSYIGPRTFTVSMIASLRALPAQGKVAPAVPAMDADGAALLGDLRARVDAVLPANDPLRQSLGLIIEQTENEYERVLGAIDAWFNSQMARVSGTFKRYAAIMQMIFALVIVDVLHVDTIALINALSKSSAAQAAVAAAQSAQAGSGLSQAVTTLVNLGLIPIGSLQPLTFWLPRLPQQQVGVALTWFAVLLGAPFWFDVLKQIVPIRLSGTKPDAGAVAAGDKQAVNPHLAA